MPLHRNPRTRSRTPCAGAQSFFQELWEASFPGEPFPFSLPAASLKNDRWGDMGWQVRALRGWEVAC